MLARADSQGIQGLPAASPPPFPAWARPVNAPETEAEAAFLAGAALARLDAIVRENPPWAGVFRRRLALERRRRQRAPRRPHRRRGRVARRVPPQPARRRSRTRRKVPARLPGARRPPDPAVALLVCRRRRGSQGSSRRSAGRGPRGGRGLRRLRPAGAVRRRAGFRPGAARPDLGRGRPSPGGRGGEGELLAAWLADAVLAQRLNWPFALPLLAAALFPGAGRRAGGIENPADGGETTRVVFAYAKAAARRRRPRGGSCAAGGEAGEGRAQIARQRGRGRAAGAARRGLPRRIVRNWRANIGARCAAAVRPAGCARRDPGTDRTRDVPALRALSDGARPKIFRRPRPRAGGPAGARALARMDGPGRSGHFRFRRAGVARELSARRRPGLQPRSHHRRHSRRIERASLRTRLRRRRVELSDETGVWRRHSGGAWRAAKGGIVAVECACPDGDRVFSADHPRGAVAVLGTGGFERRDRLAARRGAHRRRAAQPDARRALRLCHDAGVPGAIRVRKLCATCRTSRSSRTRGCSVGRAGTCSTARRWIPSCGESSG